MDEIVCIGLFAKKEPKLFSFLFMRANAFEERKEIDFLSSNEDNWIIRDIMEIRTATIADLAQIAAVEAECFPAAEAASKKEFAGRIKYYGNHFWLMFEGEKLIAFVDGFVTDKPDLADEMYEKAEMHDENGAWQMIFGVNTIPAYRKHGYAGQLLQCAIEDARKQGRKGLVLTCKEKLIAYYAKFGFENEGISESVHGNVTWYQMRYKF